MPVASYTASILAPAQSPCCTSAKRPSWGRFARSRTSATSIASREVSQEKTADGRSIDRRALFNASPKLRPMAIASPTLFIVVVKVVSAPGNFSKAKRGTFTTT